MSVGSTHAQQLDWQTELAASLARSHADGNRQPAGRAAQRAETDARRYQGDIQEDRLHRDPSSDFGSSSAFAEPVASAYGIDAYGDVIGRQRDPRLDRRNPRGPDRRFLSGMDAGDELGQRWRWGLRIIASMLAGAVLMRIMLAFF